MNFYLTKLSSALTCIIIHHHPYPLLLSSSISSLSTLPDPPFRQTAHYQNIHYSNLLSKLKSASNLHDARQLHLQLLIHGFFHPSSNDAALGSHLINSYVRVRSLKEALLVFHILPQKNHIAWNSILRGLVAKSQFSNAIEFYHGMIKQGMKPDSYTYPLILKACSGNFSLEEGRKVIRSMQTKQIVQIDCALILFFSNCGCLQEARQVFDEMTKRDLKAWSLMIRWTLHYGKWVEALNLFCCFRREGILHADSVILLVLLPTITKLKMEKLGLAFQGFALTIGVLDDLSLSNAFLDMYCKWRKTKEAHLLFRGIVHKDIVTWNTIIAGYAHSRRFKESLNLFIEMRSSCARISTFIMTTIIHVFANMKLLKQGKEAHCHALKYAFESDPIVGAALIDMYISCGCLNSGNHVFDLTRDKDVDLWTSMVTAHASIGDHSKALETFRKCSAKNVRPTFVTLVSVLPSCTTFGTVMPGKEIHGYAIRIDLDGELMFTNCLIDMYCKCGFLEHGLKLFDRMPERDLVTYNTMISAHGVHGDAERAFLYFHEMADERKIAPNKVTFVALLSACSHAGLVEKGRSLYDSMSNRYGCSPEKVHYSCMVDLLGRGGRVDEAYKFMKMMEFDDGIDVSSLLSSCMVHGNVGVADEMARGERMGKGGEDYGGCYVLLSNIYSWSERWEDAAIVRGAIKEKGMFNKAGFSWIQVGNRIHQFGAVHTVHPQMFAIKSLLETLLFEMRPFDSSLSLHMGF